MAKISLDRLCGGAVLERFSMAMAQIGQNIMDPNTGAEKARKVTITLTFKPDKSRQSVKTSIGMGVKLAPPEADETLLLIGQDLRTGHIEMSEYGNHDQVVETVGTAYVMQTEVIPPQQSNNSGSDEYYGQARGPINLRTIN